MEDSSYAAIRVDGDANLTVISSRISGRDYGIRVSHGFQSNALVIVEDTEIHGGRYGVACYGRGIAICHVINSRLQMILGQAVVCNNVGFCAVQRCRMNALRSSAITANHVQTLIIDNNIISNMTAGQAVHASNCDIFQARFLYS